MSNDYNTFVSGLHQNVYSFHLYRNVHHFIRFGFNADVISLVEYYTSIQQTIIARTTFCETVFTLLLYSFHTDLKQRRSPNNFGNIIKVREKKSIQ